MNLLNLIRKKVNYAIDIDNKEVALQVLKDRIRLHVRGILWPDDRRPVYHLQSKFGTSGPVGKKFYIELSKNRVPRSQISLQIYPRDHYLAKYALSTKKIGRHTLVTDDGIKLTTVQHPHFWHHKFYHGVPINETITINMHCNGTLCIAPWTWCRHYAHNEQCKFCTLYTQKEMAQKMGFPPVRSDEEIAEVVKIAIKEKGVRTITIASGTFASPDEVGKRFITLVSALRKIVNRPIHIQFEPISDLSLLEKFKNAGVDSIACSLEIYDEEIRKQICPGKSKIPKDQYYKIWKESVKIFGRGNILSFCILGFGEEYDNILEEVKEAAKIGVKTMFVLAQVGSSALEKNFIPSYYGKEEELLNLHIKTGKILVDNGIDFKFSEGSGCIGCQGCSAMMEACQYVRLIDRQ